MGEPTGYEKFEKMILDISPSYLEPLIREKNKDNSFKIDTSDIKYILISGFKEIRSTIDSMDIVLRLLKGKTPKTVENTEYLTFLIQTHLQEMYLLKERLNSFATKLIRKYKTVYDEKSFPKEKTHPIFELIKSTLNDVVEVRNNHVHSEKYIPAEISLISVFENASTADDKFKIHAINAYESGKKQWLNRINKNNKEAKKILDPYFDFLFMLVTVNGDFKTPQEAKDLVSSS